MTILNTVASATYIVAPSGADTYAFKAKADVITYTSSTAIALMPSIHVTNPGVFTAGTAPEGTLSNTTNDSNS